MSLSPFIKSPLTDLTGAVVSHQWNSPCADFELKALDCLEAYGLDKGLRKCDDIIRDFQECSLKTKTNARIIAIREERERQFKAGERTKENHYAETPKADSF